jgi:hypothetical protein
MRATTFHPATRACGAIFTLLLAACGETASAPEAGGSWKQDQRLTHSEGASLLSFNFARSVAVDDGGGVHVVWYDDRSRAPRVFYLRSQNSGASWAGEVPLASAVSAHPAIAGDGSNMYVVWHSQHARSDILFRRSRDRGNTWEPELRLSSSGKAAHSSVAASGNRAYVVWGDLATGNAEVHFRASSDGGATWSPEARISDTPYESWVPTVAASGDTVLVAWVDYRDANEEEYVRASYDAGRAWSVDLRLTRAPSMSARPSVALFGEEAHVVWYDAREGDSEIFYKHSPDAGLTWQSDQRLTTAPGVSAHPSIAADRNRLHVVWFDERTDNAEIFYMRGRR